MTAETSSPISDLIPYNQRDVLTLKPLSKWTPEEEIAHLEHNRILQPGFATKEAPKLIENAELAGEQWLTNICCPSVNAAIILHISKEIVVNYQVTEENLRETSHQVYKAMLQQSPQMIGEQSQIIQTKLQEAALKGRDLDELVIVERASQRLKQNEEVMQKELASIKQQVLSLENKIAKLKAQEAFELTAMQKELAPIKQQGLSLENKIAKLKTQAALEVAKEIERDLVKKAITNKVIGSFVKNQMQGKSLIQSKGARRLQDIASHITGNKHIDSSTARQIESVASKLSLQPKVFYPLGKNEDFVFLGAAGSGKSTIAKQLLPHTNKSNYIVISTDNYRAVTMQVNQKILIYLLILKIKQNRL